MENTKHARFRACPFCGGVAQAMFTHNSHSAVIACTACGAKSPTAWKGARGVPGMQSELMGNWNRSIYDEPISRLEKELAAETVRKEQAQMTEAQWMEECYARRELQSGAQIRPRKRRKAAKAGRKQTED